MENGGAPREDRWSEALAVGSLAFVERVKNDLGVKAAHRSMVRSNPPFGTLAGFTSGGTETWDGLLRADEFTYRLLQQVRAALGYVP